MGLIRAFVGAVGGSLGDQWKDFFTVPRGIAPTAAVFPASPAGINAGRGSSTEASAGIITNGSKIIVPEGYGLLILQDGEITGFSSEPGGYTWHSEDVNSKSLFVGEGVTKALIEQSWERFKFGGRPSAQQLALFVNLKELPNNRFGTRSEIYWDDAYLGTQVGALTRGTYSLRIQDPLRLIKNSVPASYLQNPDVFDLTDASNPVGRQLFSEIVACLASAFSHYVNQPDKRNRIFQIQQDAVGFSSSLAEVVENNYGWLSTRGLTILTAALAAVEYDQATRELLKAVQRADALSGSRGNSNLQASVAAGIQAAGEGGGAGDILGIGIAANSIGLGNLQQPSEGSLRPNSAEGEDNFDREAPQNELIDRLTRLKQAYEAGLITKEDYDAARAKALGI